MVNRVIQAKVVKMSRRRRLQPKKLNADYVHINIARRPEFSGNPDPLKTVFYRGTTNANEAEARAKEAFVEAMFPEQYGHRVPNGRRLAVELSKKVLEEAPPKRISLESSALHRVMMCYTSDYSRVQFLYFNFATDTLKKSKVYKSRFAALTAFNALGKERLPYVEKLKLLT